MFAIDAIFGEVILASSTIIAFIAVVVALNFVQE